MLSLNLGHMKFDKWNPIWFGLPFGVEPFWLLIPNGYYIFMIIVFY
jgi:hypothetical protein